MLIMVEIIVARMASILILPLDLTHVYRLVKALKKEQKSKIYAKGFLNRLCRLTNNFILPETRITSVKDRNGIHLPVDGSSTPSTISDSITFTFEGEQLDEDKSGQVSFKCRLDRGAVFEPCTSPITYSGLATDRYKGTFVPHTFEVVAIDNSVKKGTIDKFGNPI